MDATVDELIANADALNIEAVVHLGDVVDDSGDAVQYNNAKDIFYQLPEAGMKFLVQPATTTTGRATAPATGTTSARTARNIWRSPAPI